MENGGRAGLLRRAFDLVKAAGREWLDDKASRLAAALSFYTILSLAPLLLLVVSIVGLILGPAETEKALVDQAGSMIGESGEDLVRTVFANADRSGGILGTIVGFVVLAFGATGMVTQVQDTLNLIWEVEPSPGKGVRNTLEKRLVSFVVILAIGVLLLASLVASAAMGVVAQWMDTFLGGSEWILRLLDLAFSLALFSFVFAFTYKFLPDVRIAWGDVWIGGVVTAVLFAVGKFLVGIYLGSSGTGSAYGAFGSLVAVVVWVYYSSQIVFFGAEFTQVYARRYGSGLTPEDGAQWVQGADGTRVADDETP